MPLSRYNRGARKARRRMIAHYGRAKGLRVFYATANKRGRGKTRLKKVNSTYRTRRKSGRRRRR